MLRDPDYARSVQMLWRRLPFDPADFEAVGEVFVRWRSSKKEADREALDTWCYGYAIEYFNWRYNNDPLLQASDVSDLITKAYFAYKKKHETIRVPEVFPFWYRKICLNAYNSQRRRAVVSTTSEELIDMDADDPESLLDRATFRKVLERGVNNLPEYLRTVATLKFLDGMSNSAIEAKTQLRNGVVRSYASRAHAILRSQPEFQSLSRFL